MSSSNYFLRKKFTFLLLMLFCTAIKTRYDIFVIINDINDLILIFR